MVIVLCCTCTCCTSSGCCTCGMHVAGAAGVSIPIKIVSFCGSYTVHHHGYVMACETMLPGLPQHQMTLREPLPTCNLLRQLLRIFWMPRVVPTMWLGVHDHRWSSPGRCRARELCTREDRSYCATVLARGRHAEGGQPYTAALLAARICGNLILLKCLRPESLRRTLAHSLDLPERVYAP